MFNKSLVLAQEIDNIHEFKVFGKVSSVKGLTIVVKGFDKFAKIGVSCLVAGKLKAELISFDNDLVILLAYGGVEGISIGDRVEIVGYSAEVYPSNAWLGRVVNCFGEPIDGKGPISTGKIPYLLKASPPEAHNRRRVKGKIDLGVRAINAFTTCCRGQRLGVFSGSGVGKSMMLAMFTRYANTNVKVIGLIGERGREVQEFIEDYLGVEGLRNAVVVVATSDEAAVARKRAAYLTMAISEYFRDTGKEVLTMIDSVTRFAQAQREIGLATGEPPTTKAYPPSVFAELPKLLERAGPGDHTKKQGNITAFFSVLVEGDDNNEPISDAVRGILDGHIVLDRNIAMKGIYPAIDVLKSISRTMPMCNSEQENAIVNKAREYISIYRDIEDLVRIGAYKLGSDPKADAAIKYSEALEKFLNQNYKERDHLESTYKSLAKAIGVTST